jgi:hypothetical protein
MEALHDADSRFNFLLTCGPTVKDGTVRARAQDILMGDGPNPVRSIAFENIWN